MCDFFCCLKNNKQLNKLPKTWNTYENSLLVLLVGKILVDPKINELQPIQTLIKLPHTWGLNI